MITENKGIQILVHPGVARASHPNPIYLLVALRPRQWVKNTFVFAAIIYSQNILNTLMLYRVGIVFLIFCLLSSGIYLINDFADLERDRLHFKKRNRPLAAGFLTPFCALTTATFLLCISLLTSFILGLSLGLICMFYALLMVGYSFYLKHLLIVDVFAVALGFVLRVWAGAIVIGVPVSIWLLSVILLMSLFMALSKRHCEILSLGENAFTHRGVLARYSTGLLSRLIISLALIIIAVYTAYTLLAAVSNMLFLTVPFVAFGIFRYLHIVQREQGNIDVEELFVQDGPFVTSIILWVAITFALLYYI